MTTTEQIFAAHFALAKTVQGTDWSGTPIPLQYASRNWMPVAQDTDAIYPALYQLDPRPERDIRTGLGRSRRLLRVQLDIRIQRGPQQTYSDTQPFATLLNNWLDNLYRIFSPSDATTLGGLVADVYPVATYPDYGVGQQVAVLYVVNEIMFGG